ncbi:hypothetical protein NIES2100_39450 [Calothrix sp. NIES-2100]|nr:hypothetical protein NIES2100_39450 [Calothrix sp. NIES-2100]
MKLTAVFTYLHHIYRRGTALLCPESVVYLPENGCNSWLISSKASNMLALRKIMKLNSWLIRFKSEQDARTTEDNEAQSLINGVQTLVNGVQSLINGVQSLINEAQSLINEAQRLINGVQTLVNGVQSLINGVQSLINGVQSLINGVQRLVNGVQSLINGVQSLINGVQRLINDLSVDAIAPESLFPKIPIQHDWLIGSKILQINVI